MANREAIGSTNNMVFVNQIVYFNIDLKFDLGLVDYPNLRLRLESCTVTSYDTQNQERGFLNLSKLSFEFFKTLKRPNHSR